MTSSNPSYSLRDAIAQYAPGNSVAVDGVVYTVRGIEITNMYNDNHKAYKTIYRNSDKTVIMMSISATRLSGQSTKNMVLN